MPRVRRPTAAQDPALDIARHQLGQLSVATPYDIRRVLDETLQASPSTPRVRPIVSGTWGDGSFTAERSLVRALADLGLVDDATQVFTPTQSSFVTLGPFFLNDIPGTATTEMGLLYANTASAVNLGDSGENDFRMPVAGEVVAGFLMADSARTAGTATLRVRLDGSATVFGSNAVQLNASNTLRNSHAESTGLSFDAGALVGASLVTSGWTPTNGDATAFLVVRFRTP
jgi:hypothetical protein